jgi:bilirubin oxidase
VHWHGLHVSAKNDGGPHTVIEAGDVWSPSFTVLDNAATYWYHPHLQEHTEEQVTKGAAGFIIVRDNEEAQLELPRTYGVDDFPIAIQSRAFDTDNQFLDSTALDDVILCNGTWDPYLEVPAQVFRLRLLNGSTERVFNFELVLPGASIIENLEAGELRENDPKHYELASSW